MTGFVTFWIVSGVISAVWNFFKDLGKNDILGIQRGLAVILGFLTFGLHLILGPISLAITLWESFFDPSNI